MADIKQINLAGTTYNLVDDTAVHSVSVSSSQSSGTQIGTITVDGTTTTLYAPNGSTDYYKVCQNAAITTAGNYPVMLGGTTVTTAITSTLNKTDSLKYNPSTKLLQAGALGVISEIGYTTTLPTTTNGYENGQIMFVVFDET